MKVKLLRGSAIDGQAILVSTEKRDILIDAGMDMRGNKPLPLEGVANVDYLFITHAHLDHSGEIPTILREFPHCRFICNEDTEKIIQILFDDPIYLKGRKNFVAPKPEGYTDVNGRVELNDFILHIFRAGHIIGASSFAIEAGGKKIMVSGDISIHDLPTAPAAKIPGEFAPDVLFLESTYGDKIFPKREEEEARFVEKVDEVLLRGGNVLIPAFSVGRTQDIALTLKKHGIASYIDGMGVKIANAFGLDDIRRVADKNHREKIMNKKGNAIIVAAGFLAGGFVLSYLKRWAGQKDSAILFPSPYQNGLAKDITDGKKSVVVREKFYNKKIKKMEERTITLNIRAEVEKYYLSAHADQNGLTEYVKSVSPKKVILIHGESDAKIALAEKLRFETRAEIHIAKDGDEYEV